MRSVRTISRKGLSGENLGYFLTGFVEGEGSFNVSQKDPSILYLLKNTLECGIIKVRKFDDLYSYDVTKPQDIIDKIIPYFEIFPIVSKSKKTNFETFCKIASLMKQGKHRNLEGLKLILHLREKLNEGKGRTRKYGIKDVFSE